MVGLVPVDLVTLDEILVKFNLWCLLRALDRRPFGAGRCPGKTAGFSVNTSSFDDDNNNNMGSDVFGGLMTTQGPAPVVVLST